MLNNEALITLHNNLRSDIKRLVTNFNKESGMTVDNIHLNYWREPGKLTYLKTVQTKLTLPNYNELQPDIHSCSSN